MSNSITGDKSLDDARQRIVRAFDPDLFRQSGHRLTELLADHFVDVATNEPAVLNWRAPAENIAEAALILEAADDGANIDRADRFTELVRLMLSRGHNLHHRHYIGHQVPASIPLAGLFDAVGSVTNQVMAIYEMGPWATAVECALVERLGQLIGWQPETFAGLITHGGSLANLTALLTARNVVLPDSWESGVAAYDPAPVLIVHAEAHYCIARSAGILGLGTRQVLRAELDEQRRIDPEKLNEHLAGLRARNIPIVAVAACACATPVGAFDRLGEIADVCARHDVWLHVDAAHGGAVAFSERHRHLIAGIDRVDSFIWDAHKMLFAPALCAFVFYRDRAHQFEAFRQNAPYLFDPSDPGIAAYDSGLKTVECTKRAAAFGLWGAWSLFGRQIFADMVDVTFDLARQLYEMLESADDFLPLHQPECNIVVFRHVPAVLKDADSKEIGRFQLELRRAVIRSGEFYIVPTVHNGVEALRVSVMNPNTQTSDLLELLDSLRRHADQIVAS